MSTHNISFYGVMWKITPKLSSNTQLLFLLYKHEKHSDDHLQTTRMWLFSPLLAQFSGVQFFHDTDFLSDLPLLCIINFQFAWTNLWWDVEYFA